MSVHSRLTAVQRPRLTETSTRYGSRRFGHYRTPFSQPMFI